MNVLVLGASSFLGAEIAAGLAAGNRMILTGRQEARLETAAAACRARGAGHVRTVAHDLGQGLGPLQPSRLGDSLDLIVLVASSTSRLRDPEIGWDLWQDCLLAEVQHPLALVRAWLDAQPGRPLTVCLVSSFLADFRSPGRVVYGALKALQEQGLRSALAGHPHLSLRIVKLGQTYSRERGTASMTALASRIKTLVEQPGACRVVEHGLPGRVWKGLYFAQPLVFSVLNRLQRTLRGAFSRG